MREIPDKARRTDRRTIIELTSWAWENQTKLHGLSIQEIELKALEDLPHRFSTKSLLRVLAVVGVKPNGVKVE